MLTSLIPAAQYLRMSTEDQQYSIANQRARIQEYARQNGFEIVKSYEDPGKSGVILKHRKGLRALLSDVVGGEAKFRAILVYDISRWGRFQNPDEAAHYEFLCARSGIPLHYCAEQFTNDGTQSSNLLKSLKRNMAAEFSRELGEKVFLGKSRLAGMGFWMGGPPGYGYRRCLLSGDGKRKQVLKDGERKSLTTDRVTLVQGPRKEVETIRLIFAMAAEGRHCTNIARELNRRRILMHGKQWRELTIRYILRNPTYTGASVWYRHTQRLRTPQKLVDPQFWIARRYVFPSIVDQQTFDDAQAMISKLGDSHWSAEKVLKRIRLLLKTKGRLSQRIILEAQGTPSIGTIRRYFGSHRHLYQMLRYRPERSRVNRLDQSRRSARLRQAICDQLKALFPDNLTISRTKRGGRSVLRIDDTFVVSVLFCRSERLPRQNVKHRRWNVRSRPFTAGTCWGARPASAEREYITLLCLLSKKCDRVVDFYIADGMGDRAYIRLRKNDAFLRHTLRLENANDFYATATKVWRSRKAKPEIATGTMIDQVVDR